MRSHDRFKSVPALVFTGNVWLKEAPQDNRFVIHQQEGFYPMEILKLLNAAASELRLRDFLTVAGNLEPLMAVASSL